MNKDRMKAIREMSADSIPDKVQRLPAYVLGMHGGVMNTESKGLARAVRRHGWENGVRYFGLRLRNTAPWGFVTLRKAKHIKPAPQAEQIVPEVTVAPHRQVSWFQRAKGFMAKAFGR